MDIIEALENCTTFQDFLEIINSPGFFDNAEFTEKIYEFARDTVVAASEDYKEKKKAVVETIAEAGYTIEDLWEHGRRLKNREPGIVSWSEDTQRKVDEKFKELHDPINSMCAFAQVMKTANEHRENPDPVELMKLDLEARGVPSRFDKPSFIS